VGFHVATQRPNPNQGDLPCVGPNISSQIWEILRIRRGAWCWARQLEKALEKFAERSAAWANLHLGLPCNALVYNTFILPVLGFVMQLELEPADLDEHIRESLVLLAPGPGKWTTQADLANLSEVYGFPCSFRDARCLAKAAKLRIVSTLAQDCGTKVDGLVECWLTQSFRPHGQWHLYGSYHYILQKNKEFLAERGVTGDKVNAEILTQGIDPEARCGFQNVISTSTFTSELCASTTSHFKCSLSIPVNALNRTGPASLQNVCTCPHFNFL